jgi:hypothetical protein
VLSFGSSSALCQEAFASVGTGTCSISGTVTTLGPNVYVTIYLTGSGTDTSGDSVTVTETISLTEQ